MIRNKSGTIKHIVSWIADYIKNNSIQSAAVIEATYNDRVVDILLRSAADRVQGNISIKTVPVDANPVAFDILKLKQQDHLIVSGLDLTASDYCRQYNKAEQFLCDIFPLKDLLYSEVLELGNYLGIDISAKGLEGYELYEWGFNYLDMIKSENFPNRDSRWKLLTKSQKEFIAKIHAREKSTRHKIIHGPYCKVAHLESLICRHSVFGQLQAQGR
jgi:hypothetical protein